MPKNRKNDVPKNRHNDELKNSVVQKSRNNNIPKSSQRDVSKNRMHMSIHEYEIITRLVWNTESTKFAQSEKFIPAVVASSTNVLLPTVTDLFHPGCACSQQKWVSHVDLTQAPLVLLIFTVISLKSMAVWWRSYSEPETLDPGYQ